MEQNVFVSNSLDKWVAIQTYVFIFTQPLLCGVMLKSYFSSWIVSPKQFGLQRNLICFLLLKFYTNEGGCRMM